MYAMIPLRTRECRQRDQCVHKGQSARHRLAVKGYVRREPNPADGRSVFIAADADRIAAELTPLFAGWTAALHTLHGRYSDQELGTILDLRQQAAAQ